MLVGGACAYALLAVMLAWPLPRHLTTHLLGDPAGDLGVYVWNTWILEHEIVNHRRVPFSTDHIFAYTGAADFSLHNYAPIAGLLGMPLIGMLGVVGTFNVLTMAFGALSGLGVYALARRLGLRRVTAWCAGALFVASPTMIAKGSAHFSLIIAAPLPLFLWALLRALDTQRVRDGVLVGVLVAAATYSDAYYGIYCAMMGACIVGWRFTRVEWRGPTLSSATVIRWLDRALGVAGVVIAAVVLSRTTAVVVGPVRIGLSTLYTPALLVVILVALRMWLVRRPILRVHDPADELRGLLRLGLLAVSASLVLLSPLIVGVALRFLSGRLPDTEIFWRSSPRGLDLLAYVVPNPNHPWFGQQTRPWFMPNLSDAFPEFVGAFSLVALAVIAVAAWQRRLPGLWVAFTVFFVSLSLGPFVHIGGLNTTVIGPWALLRYLPLVGMARSPSRFAIVAILGMSVLFAFALEELLRRRQGTRHVTAVVIALAMVAELWPAPRPLYSADVPRVYRMVAAAADESGHVLELPTGVRDGTSSLGNFNSSSQYFQTAHRHPLVGGYLSRVSRKRKDENRNAPMLGALNALSEGRPLSMEERQAGYRSRDAFLRRTCVRFVIADTKRASGDLRAFAVDALGLMLVDEDAGYQLFAVPNAPPCAPK